MAVIVKITLGCNAIQCGRYSSFKQYLTCSTVISWLV